MTESVYQILIKELDKPDSNDKNDLYDNDFFKPWSIFPMFYGTYSSAFDDMALQVLNNILLFSQINKSSRDGETLAHEMFKEVLCNGDLCDYGVSPRVCFPNYSLGFDKVLPKLIQKWENYSKIRWG